MGGLTDCLVLSSDAVNPSIRDFSALVEAEQRRIFHLCFRLLRDRDEADSVTQDVFLKAYRALQKPGQPAIDEPAKWLTRIAVNTCLDLLRSRKWQLWRRRPEPADEELILAGSAAAGPDAEDFLFAKQIHQRLAQALGRLSPRQRAVFTLRHEEDLSLDEIGAMLGLDTGTVKAHMARAVAKLREELREFYESLPARGGKEVRS
jgi:RNA polymerase sigma-70 factor (ECF subfamily)